MDIHLTKIRDKRGTGPAGRIPDEAEILHTELAGGTGPLIVYYGIRGDE